MSETCDVLVIGSGAGGLSAAVTAAHHGLRVIVAEKAEVIGGTSAWSGGWLWIPRNPLAVDAGIVEAPEAPMRYLRSEIGNRAGDPRIAAFLEAGPRMVGFFRDHTAVDWMHGNHIPDFHVSEGACEGGRSVCAAPYDGALLGDWAGKLRPPLGPATLWGMGLSAGADMTRFFNWKTPANAAYVLKRLGRHGADLLRHGRGMQLVGGNALVARLLRSALDLGVGVRTGAPALGLLTEGPRVTGARLSGGEVFAARGVVLAAGGFPHDPARQARLFGHADHRSAAPRENTGDGLALGEAAGGTVAEDMENAGAWAPVSVLPGDTPVHFPHLIDRGKPGFVMVGPDGRRFTNEANSYHDVMSDLFRAYPRSPFAWIVADAPARRRFGIGAAKPFPFPDGPHVGSGYLIRAGSLAGLGGMTALPADTLAATVARFNEGAKLGRDPDHGRGTTPYNRMLGDAAQGPNPSLAPLTTAPFYAVKLVPGSLGTFAGLETDAQARVLDAGSAPIPGLHAVGNDAASIFGGHYPSGGITLGPAMTFGYIAGRALAGLNS